MKPDGSRLKAIIMARPMLSPQNEHLIHGRTVAHCASVRFLRMAYTHSPRDRNPNTPNSAACP